ncbi:SLC13 family permease [Algivirga pacifica]
MNFSLYSPEYTSYIVFAVLIAIIVALYLNIRKPSTIFFFGALALILLGVTTPSEFLKGFSNQSIGIVIILTVISSIVNKSFPVDRLFNTLFKGIKSSRAFLTRMTTLVAIFSSFFNNTPVVALMTPYVYKWCKDNGAHSSKMLIPLSYATILGGMITMIGTSTNLMVNGLIQSAGLPGLQFSDFLYLGLIVTIIGVLYLITFAQKILPKKNENFNDARNIAPEYWVETEVIGDSPLVGKTVKDSGLQEYSKEGAYLIELHRAGEVITPVTEQVILEAHDHLYFMGQREKIITIIDSGIGLILPKHKDDKRVVEAIIPAHSPLIDCKNTDIDLPKKYDAELLAVQRDGKKVQNNLKDVTFKSGDMVLLSIDETFLRNKYADHAFYIVSEVVPESDAPNRKHKRNFILEILTLGTIIGTALGLWSVFMGVLLIFALLLFFRYTSTADSITHLDADLLVLLVSALAISNAFTTTGAAKIITNVFVTFLYNFGTIGVLTGLFILTVILTSFVTNIAAVSIVFPIAYSAALHLQIDGTPFFVGIAFAASAAFLTPVSYQTNWMVYSLGQYTPKDYFFTGLPLTILYTAVCIAFISLRYQL